jgi:phage terminase small subunit
VKYFVYELGKEGGDDMALTDKQEKFVQGLIAGKSQREAYRAAYPRSLNWTDKSVDETASKLLKNPKVFPRYEDLHSKMIKEAEDECILDGKMILKELMNIAFSSGSDFAKVITNEKKRRRLWDEEAGEYVYINDQFVEIMDTDQLPDKKKAAIKSIKQGRHGIEIETYSKDHALELLGKHLGLFKDKIELSGNVNNPFAGLTTEELKKMIEDE